MPNLKREFHPLFMPEPDGPKDYEPEEFTKILVKRLAAYGPLARGERSPAQAMRLYTPEELATLETFMETFGGGSYEVRAIMDNGRMYARRWLNVPGDSKSLVPDLNGSDGSPATQPTGLASTPGMDPMLALLISLMGEGRRESASMMQAMMQMQAQTTTAMMGVIGAIVQGSGNKDSVSDMMRGFAEISRAAQSPVPQQSAAEVIKESLATTKMIREEVAANTPPEPSQPEESTSSILRTVGELAMPIVQGIIEKQASNAAAVAATPLFAPVPG